MSTLSPGSIVNATDADDYSFSTTDVSYFEFLLDRELLGDRFIVRIPRSAATVVRPGYKMMMYTYGIPLIKGEDDFIIYYDLSNYPSCNRISIDGWFTTDAFTVSVPEGEMVWSNSIIYYDPSIVKNRYLIPQSNAPITTDYESTNECIVYNPTDHDLHITSFGYPEGRSYVTNIPPGQYFVSLCDPAMLDSGLQYILVGAAGEPAESIYTKDIVITEDKQIGSGIFDMSSGMCNGSITLPTSGTYRITFKTSDYARLYLYDNNGMSLGVKRIYNSETTSIVVSGSIMSSYEFEIQNSSEISNAPKASFHYEYVGDSFNPLKSVCATHTYFINQNGKLTNTSFMYTNGQECKLFNETLGEEFIATPSPEAIVLPETWLVGHSVNLKIYFGQYADNLSMFHLIDATDHFMMLPDTHGQVPPSDFGYRLYISYGGEFDRKLFLHFNDTLTYTYGSTMLTVPAGTTLLSVDRINVFLEDIITYEFTDNSTSDSVEVGLMSSPQVEIPS